MSFYTGIGSRQTPSEVLTLMRAIARKLRSQGYTLRSGHAQGADRAFELGADGQATIYLPWKSFGTQAYRDDIGMTVLGQSVCDERAWYANYARLEKAGIVRGNSSQPVQLLHGRNVAQVEGHPGGELSRFVIGWAPIQGDSVTGGTRIAFEFAKSLGVPVFNLAEDDTMKRLKSFVG